MIGFVPWFNSNKTEKTRCITSKFNPGRNLTYQTMAIFFAAGWPTHLFQHFNILGPKPRRFPFWWSPIGGIFWCFCLRLIGWPKVRLFGDQMTKVTDLVLDNHPKKHIETKIGSSLCLKKPLKKATWLGIYSWSRGCETHRWRPSVSSKAMRSALSSGNRRGWRFDTSNSDATWRWRVESLGGDSLLLFFRTFWKPASVIENVTIRNLEGKSSRKLARRRRWEAAQFVYEKAKAS